MKSTSHVCCILPPHILHKLSEHPEHRQRALRALAITERLRGRREVFAQFAAGLSAGQKRRTIYDAQHQTELPGTLIRGEDDDKPRSSVPKCVIGSSHFRQARHVVLFNRSSTMRKTIRLLVLLSFLLPLSAFSQYSTSVTKASIYDATPYCGSQQCWVGGFNNPYLIEMSASDDGTVYGVDYQQAVWKLPLGTKVWQSTAFSPMAHIAVISATNIWALHSSTCSLPNYNVYHWISGQADFKSAGGPCLSQISAASDGTIWGVRADGAIFYHNSDGTWGSSGISGATGNGRVTKVAVGSKDFIWLITATNVIKQWNASTRTFSIVSGWASDIAANSSSQAWVVGNTNNGSNVYLFDIPTDTWLAEIGNVDKITSGGPAYTLAYHDDVVSSTGGTLTIQRNVYHFNNIGVGATATIQGTYNCNQFVSGCPAGSFHTVTASGHFGTRAATSRSASGSPSTYLSAGATDGTTNCDLIFGNPSDPECQFHYSGCGQCSVMGSLGCFAGGGFPLPQLEYAKARFINEGTITTSCYTKRGRELCNEAVTNWCTAATTPPDSDFSFIRDEVYPSPPSPFYDTTSLCARPGSTGAWACVLSIARRNYNSSAPLYSCTHNP